MVQSDIKDVVSSEIHVKITNRCKPEHLVYSDKNFQSSRQYHIWYSANGWSCL